MSLRVGEEPAPYETHAWSRGASFGGYACESFFTEPASSATVAPQSTWLDEGAWALIHQSEKTVVQIGDMGIRFPCAAEVKAYLQEHPDLAALMVAMAGRACEAFGTESSLSFEMIHDPEDGDRYAAIQVRFAQYPEDLLPRIDRVNGEFAEQRLRASGWFYLTTDFRRVE